MLIPRVHFAGRSGVGGMCLSPIRWVSDFLIVRALTRDHLVFAVRAPLHIATGDMELPFRHGAIMARSLVGPPVLAFLSVSDPGIELATN